MPAATKIHRADVVGSMLRPPRLVEARAALRAGGLAAEEYRAIEDAAVDDAIRIQEEAGVDVVTDGEMRRDVFFDPFLKGLTGFEMRPSYTVRFRNRDSDVAMEVPIPFTVVERVRALPCPALEELAYAQQRTEKPIKVTLPSPLMITGFWNEASRDAYPDPYELIIDAGEAIRGWFRELAEAGCTYIQLDAPDLAELHADARVRAEWERRGFDARSLLDLGTDLAESFAAQDLPGVTTAMHVCKGNGTQAWIAEGGYESFSRHVFTSCPSYDVFHLEYDDERSGGFEPLAKLPDDKVAVLGLISTKWTRLEDPAELAARIEDAAGFHPKDHLAIATQCGFASSSETAEQRRITEQTQRDKLALVARVAREVWGR
jgi:5-methyltetrahydropteroyltriglutamate--homocysteine methyltransferase